MARQFYSRSIWILSVVSVQILLLQLAPVSLASLETLEHKLTCSMLPTDLCAFAVDSSGKRCVLETVPTTYWHVCQTSPVTVGAKVPLEYIETDQCVKACGASKNTLGLSTDPLLSLDTTRQLCSSACSDNCPNLIDLYSSLAKGEGRTLEQICMDHTKRRQIPELDDDEGIDVDVDRSNLQASSPAPPPTSGA